MTITEKRMPQLTFPFNDNLYEHGKYIENKDISEFQN